MSEIKLPIIEVDGKKWIKLNVIDDKFIFRAYGIEKPRRVPEPSGDRVDQTVGEGSPKCRPKKMWDISGFQ